MNMLVEQFVEQTRAYVLLVESVNELLIGHFLTQCAITLPGIYSLGLQLPDVRLPDEDPLEILSEGVTSPLSSIRQLLGKYDPYSEVFDPIYDKEAITTILSDDLADIYLDLKRPLIKFDSQEKPNMLIATWEWKFNLRGHCGSHIVDALRPIHRLVFDHYGSELQ